MRAETGTRRQRSAETFRRLAAGPEPPRSSPPPRFRPSLWLPALWHRRGWRLYLAVCLGMLTTVALICVVPLYTTLVSNAQLQTLLTTHGPTATNLDVQIGINPVLPDALDAANAQVRDLANQSVRSFAPDSTWYIAADDYLLPVAINRQDPFRPPYGLRSDAQMLPMALDFAHALPHMHLLAGRLPQSVSEGQLPEALVTPKLGPQPGDTLTLEGKLTVRVVGVWFPKDPADPFWNGHSYDTNPSSPGLHTGEPPPPPIYPLLFTRETFVSALGPTSLVLGFPHPTLGLIFHVIYFTQSSVINTGNMGDVATQIGSLRAGLSGTIYQIRRVNRLAVETQLDALIAGLQLQLRLLAQPLSIVIALVVGMALLFVGVMAALLVESQDGVIATLKSRGASQRQVLANFALQGLLLAAVAALAGPVIAIAVSLAVVRFFVPTVGAALGSLFASASLPRIVAPDVVAFPALLGALLGVVAMTFAAWRTARLDVLALHRQLARGGRDPLWKRAYLDLVLAALGVAGYLELSQFGGLEVRGQSSQSGTSLLQTAAPGLLLLAGALVLLRLFPLVARLGTHLAARIRRATPLLAFAEMTRTPGRFSRLALLLTLTIGAALFALTLQSSLRSNAVDRANFLTGCDQRVLLKDVSEGAQLTAPLQPRFAAMPGVFGVTLIYRSLAAPVQGDTAISAGVLGVDSATFAQVASWRDDFADRSLAALMASMQTRKQNAPAGDAQHPLWALVDATFAAKNSLKPGGHFALAPRESSTSTLYFIAGAIVSDFPTMSDESQAGFIVVEAEDYIATLHGTPGGFEVNGPNEYWLRTTSDPRDDSARALALQDPDLFVSSILDRRALTSQVLADPLISGVLGLLSVSTLTAALLAVLGSLVYAGAAVRPLAARFTVLRLLGTDRRALVGIVLSQQVVVYGFSLVGGTLLGLLLAAASLPFVQFSTSTADVGSLRLPPSGLAVDCAGTAALFAALLAALVVTLVLMAYSATRGGLGEAARLAED